MKRTVTVPSTRPPFIPVAALVALALLIAVLAARVWQQSRAPRRPDGNTRAALLQLPEAHLYYPGAVVLAEVGSDPSRFLGGVAPATAGAYLGVDATQEDIFAFYMAHLAAAGWTYTPQRIAVNSTETAGRTWASGDHELYVNIVRNTQPDPRLPEGITAYRTVYVMHLVYSPAPVGPTPR